MPGPLRPVRPSARPCPPRWPQTQPFPPFSSPSQARNPSLSRPHIQNSPERRNHVTSRLANSPPPSPLPPSRINFVVRGLSTCGERDTSPSREAGRCPRGNDLIPPRRRGDPVISANQRPVLPSPQSSIRHRAWKPSVVHGRRS
ncbi:hypothetical protein LY78DRAFT_278760 [Colletotrichum sublineola]|nr:hypothetical protein LY78DRAFT_278760 [Colletotrichum sublineola]